MLHVIKMWLAAPVEEIDEKGNKHRSTRNRYEGKGTPQGAPISPLLSNLYMRRFVLGWKKLGHEKRLAAHIVRHERESRKEEQCNCLTDEILTLLRSNLSELNPFNSSSPDLVGARLSAASCATDKLGYQPSRMQISAASNATPDRTIRLRRSARGTG
jgi:hypothetical protein